MLADAKSWAIAHLMLAEGFLKTADIEDDPSVYRVRNALSRSYYALFHVCCAWLVAAGLEREKVNRIAHDKGSLHGEVGKRTNRFIRRLLEESYDMRRKADYEADWQPPNASACRDHVRRMRTQFYWLYGTAQRTLESS